MVECSWQKHTKAFQETGTTFDDVMVEDVLDEFGGRGIDTGLHSIQALVAYLVPMGPLLEDKAAAIQEAREHRNVIPIRRPRVTS